MTTPSSATRNRSAGRALTGAVLAAALGLASAPGALALDSPAASGALIGKPVKAKPLPVGDPSDATAGEAAAAQKDGWRQGDLRLDASQNAAVEAFLNRAAKAEKTISPQIRTVAAWTGAELVGFDYRLKSEESTKRKIATWLKDDPNQTVHEALDDLNDSVRYTLVWQDGEYTEGAREASHMLVHWGHDSVRWANTWKNRTGYKAINAAWKDPMWGHKFEVQLHTPASKWAAELTHPLYEELRLPSTSPERKAELAAEQARIFAAVPVPAGAAELKAPEFTRPPRVPQPA
ncbi:ATP nucleotide 3'-pyrophosphokinase [Streptomyces sp. JJ38]|uniref:ATP nucleotide 3'-pyrophosphokinase n=1 Tax=Streptomyces sp. JJ38 TaxID=2738128 RepID=UPI001C58E97D|nr:ATP nucleotide 3'-pyrophosphokinase [Streptomyces sp. JJ38]MBW1598715.1 ATP nucleotide 3'-pyrophosphokinase [Streptomyces sp. JJ38]